MKIAFILSIACFTYLSAQQEPNADVNAKYIYNEVTKMVKEAGDKVGDQFTQVNKTIVEEINKDDSSPCTSATCYNNGFCVGSLKQPFCICQIGFAGEKCNEKLCDPAIQCQGHGVCFGTTTKFTCICGLGYAGDNCERKTSDEKEVNKINE